MHTLGKTTFCTGKKRPFILQDLHFIQQNYASYKRKKEQLYCEIILITSKNTVFTSKNTFFTRKTHYILQEKHTIFYKKITLYFASICREICSHKSLNNSCLCGQQKINMEFILRKINLLRYRKFAVFLAKIGQSITFRYTTIRVQ